MSKDNKINLKFYNEKNAKFEDSFVEDSLLESLKSNLSTEEILNKNSEWSFYYNLSKKRENILNWYQFNNNCTILEIGCENGALTNFLCNKSKFVTCIEKSKKKASVVSERTKKYNNLEIFVGDFNEIKFNRKFDYITLIGTMDSILNLHENNRNKAYADGLLKLKRMLNPNGKILLAIENKYGLKYWCGAPEERTSKIFGGINNYECGFSKKDLEKLFKIVGLHYNFYYPLPDYKFPEQIFTDEFFKSQENIYYTPYYSQPFNMFVNERKIFSEIVKNDKIDFFANSFFIELSIDECSPSVKFAKINSSRLANYANLTYKKNDKFYKKCLCKEGAKHLNNIYEYDSVLKKYNIETVTVKKDNEGIYTEDCEMSNSLMDNLVNLYLERKIDDVYENINKFIKFLENKFNRIDVSKKQTIFEQYEVEIADNVRKKLHFVKDGFIDLTFQNVLLKENEYLIIDQEWREENVPLEYIVYRAVHLFAFDYLRLNGCTNNLEIFDNIINNICLDIKSEEKLFDALDKKFMQKVFGNNIEFIISNSLGGYNDFSGKIDDAVRNYDSNMFLIDELKRNVEILQPQVIENKNEIDKLNDTIKENNEKIRNLNNNIDEKLLKISELENSLNSILNSKTWKLKMKIDKILHRNRKK